ncbi:hypothetical protein F5877DRAFT_72476 [Lentinula edodes]|nr:hypothetical protein F5877DRAFT_72476 [Lentinula edodes]
MVDSGVGEMGRERESVGTEIGLRLGTGIKEHTGDLVARVFEYPPLRDTRDRRDMGGTSSPREEGEGEGEGEVEAEVIQIHQIPREGIPPSHPHPSSPIPPTTQKHVPLIPLQVEKEEEHEGEGEEEDINPFHHSPNPSASSPYPAPLLSSAPSASSSRPPSSRPPVVSAPGWIDGWIDGWVGRWGYKDGGDNVPT